MPVVVLISLTKSMAEADFCKIIPEPLLGDFLFERRYIMGEVGEVVGREGNRLVVKMQRTEACAKCRACTAGLESKDMIIKAVDMCSGNIGDKVEIVLDNSNFMKATLIMYGIPFIAFMLGVFGGYYGAAAYGLGSPELMGIGAGVILVALTYMLIRTQEHRFKEGGYIPKAINVVK